MRRGLLIGLTWLLVAMPAAAADCSSETVTIGGLKVVVWAATGQAAAKKPVIIFSHGFHGTAKGSRFLMEALAAHGYLVFAPYHRDSIGLAGVAIWFGLPEELFRKPAQWSSKTYRNRAEDIRRLGAGLKTDERFRDQADLTRLGLIGHSLGGYTVLGLGGAWPDWWLADVRAVLALSPYAQPFVVHQTLGGLKVPVMYQGGTWDYGLTVGLRKARGAYDQSPAPKYFVEFSGIGHFGWTDFRSSAHREIIAYSLAFLDHYVKGQAPAPLLTQAQPRVAKLCYDSELGASGPAAGGDGERPSWGQRLRQWLGGRAGSQAGN